MNNMANFLTFKKNINDLLKYIFITFKYYFDNILIYSYKLFGDYVIDFVIQSISKCCKVILLVNANKYTLTGYLAQSLCYNSI